MFALDWSRTHAITRLWSTLPAEPSGSGSAEFARSGVAVDLVVDLTAGSDDHVPQAHSASMLSPGARARAVAAARPLY